MALSTLRTNLSGLFKTKDTAETPQLYLKLTSKCMKQADSMVSFGASTSPKFNLEQCKYLADKLKVAVWSAHSFLEPINTWHSKLASDEDRGRYFQFASDEDSVRSLEIFKLLFALGKEVQTFIHDCSKEAWIQSAIILTNVTEHISSLGFHLELCTMVFSNEKKFGAIPVWTVAEVASIRKAEGEIAKEKSNIDQLRLYEDVGALIQSSKPSGADQQQARFLLERLRSPGLHPNADSQESKQSSCPAIGMSSLIQMEILGKGSFGIVHRAMWMGSVEVAEKTFHGRSAPDFEQEVKILEGLSHPNIASLLWYTRDERKCYMILELMDGDLYSLMQERMEECGTGGSPFSFSEALHIMLQVAEGMLFLHEKRIVHRDLKSSNILVKRLKVPEVGMRYVQAKVADFGLSRTKERSMTYSIQTQNQGTARWMAPEMIKMVNDDGQVDLEGEELLKYPFKVDVYGFGMVCFEILTGDIPFPTLTLKEVKRKVLGGDRPELPDQCPYRLRYLIEACWSSNPNSRPPFGDICAELRHLKCAHYMTSAWTKAPRYFSLKEIKKMTKEFNRHNYIGAGGYGEVYKGVMVDTGEVVAVKRVLRAKNSRSNLEEFRAQVEVLPRLHHNNVVGYVGFCMEKGEGIVVFEYMPNGSLHEWLSEDARKVNLTWPVRRNICLGMANGIHYLHSLSQPIIVHRDIHRKHILLDQNLEPKVVGFSLAYLLPDDESDAEVVIIRGSSGFLAPEYVSNEKLSQKIDVYNFGVVLLEIISGRRWFDISLPGLPETLDEWAQRLHSERRINELIDRSLDLQPDEENEAVRVIRIALLCVYRSSKKRPDMGLVVAMLQGNLDADISRLLLERLESTEEMRFGTSDSLMDWPPPTVSIGSFNGEEHILETGIRY